MDCSENKFFQFCLFIKANLIDLDVLLYQTSCRIIIAYPIIIVLAIILCIAQIVKQRYLENDMSFIRFRLLGL